MHTGIRGHGLQSKLRVSRTDLRKKYFVLAQNCPSIVYTVFSM